MDERVATLPRSRDGNRIRMPACRPCRVRRLSLPFTPTALMPANQQNAGGCGHPVMRSGGCQTTWALHWSWRSTQRTAATGAGPCGDGMSTLSGGTMVVRPGSGTSGSAARTSAVRVASRRLMCCCGRHSGDGPLRLTRGSYESRDSALTTLGRAVCEENPGRWPVTRIRWATVSCARSAATVRREARSEAWPAGGRSAVAARLRAWYAPASRSSSRWRVWCRRPRCGLSGWVRDRHALRKDSGDWSRSCAARTRFAGVSASVLPDAMA